HGRRVWHAPKASPIAVLDAAAVGLERGVDAALGLVEAAPASGAGILARLDLGRARHAADRRVALGDQRVLGELVARRVRSEVSGRPGDQGVDLDPGTVALERRQARPDAVLETLAAGKPGVEPFQRAPQRLGLADLAAEI